MSRLRRKGASLIGPRTERGASTEKGEGGLDEETFWKAQFDRKMETVQAGRPLPLHPIPAALPDRQGCASSFLKQAVWEIPTGTDWVVLLGDIASLGWLELGTGRIGRLASGRPSDQESLAYCPWATGSLRSQQHGKCGALGGDTLEFLPRGCRHGRRVAKARRTEWVSRKSAG